MKYIRYKDVNNIDINELKRMQSINLLEYIKEKNIDIDDAATDLGMTEDEFLNILSEPKKAKGSELLLISDYYKSLEKGKSISK